MNAPATLPAGSDAVITDAVVGRVIVSGIAPGVRVRITEVIEPAPRPVNSRFRRDVPQVRYAATMPGGAELEFFADELTAP